MTGPAASRGAWSLFPVGMLRSAGLPAPWLADLASPRLAQGETERDAAHAHLVAARRRAVAELRARKTEREAGRPLPPVGKAVNRALDRRRTLPDGAEQVLSESARRDWHAALARDEAARRELEAAWDEATSREHAALLGRLREDGFAEALLLNSRGAHDALLRDAAAGALSTANQRVAYRYLQRLCGKAESGGHGGPVNLVRFGSAPAGRAPSVGTEFAFDDPLLGTVRWTALGDGRAAVRRVFVSHWAAQALVDTLVGESADAALLRPCRAVGARAAGGSPCTPAEERLLAHADGATPLSEIAARVGRGVPETRELAAGLAERGLLVLAYLLPGHVGDPGAAAAAVARAAGTERASRVLAWLDSAERLACHPYRRRSESLDRLAAGFTARTGRAATRGSGGFYADRFVVSEEAADNIVGARVAQPGADALQDRLGTVLDLLASCAVAQRRSGQRAIGELLREVGGDGVPAAAVRRLALPPGAAPRLPDAFAALLPPAEPWVELTRSDLERVGLVRLEDTGWPLCGAADLMLCGAPTADAGPGEIVLSELHHIWPPLAQPWRELFSDQRWELEELRARLAALLAPARPLVQQVRREQKGTDCSPPGDRLLCLERLERGPGTEPVSLDELVVRRWENGFLGLSSPARGEDYWLFPEYEDAGVDVGGLAHCALPALELPRLRLGEHTPRLVVDGVVLQRRRWDPPVAAVPALPARGATGRHWRSLHSWRTERGMPRRVFFLTDAEPKPMWLDFDSALSVANLSHALRKARTVTFTEMLPLPESLWLRTPQGPLVSEIRTLLTRGPAGEGAA